MPNALAASAPPTERGLADLRQLLRHPEEVFFRARLNIRFAKLEEASQEQEPFALDALQKHALGQQLLQSTSPTLTLADQRRSGRLPLAAFGEKLAEALEREASVVRERREPWLAQFPHACPALSVVVQLDGCTLSGTLGETSGASSGSSSSNASIFYSAQPITDATPASRVATPCLQLAQRVGAVLEGRAGAQAARGHIVTGLWINHLAACASGMVLTSVQLGLDGEVLFAPVPQQQALDILQGLLQAYRAAWQRPLPVACKTGWAWLRAEAKEEKSKDPHEVAQAEFEGGYQRRGEWADSPYLARAFGSYQDIEDELPQWAQALYGDMAAHASVPAAARAPATGEDSE